MDKEEELVESENESVVDSDNESVIEVNEDDDFYEKDQNLDEDEKELEEPEDENENEKDDEYENDIYGRDDDEQENTNNVPNIITNDDLSDNDDEDLDEDYLQKFNKDIRNNICETYHPELKIYSAREIETASLVIRNDDGCIIDPLHKTLPFMTCYEKARILGERAKQIESGAQAFVQVDENIIDSYLIANMELEQKKIPFIIQRPLPNGTSEYWRVSDLEYLE